MRNGPRCARASSRPLALSAVPGGAALGDAFTRRASAAEEDLDEDADDVAGDEDRAHVPASRGSAPALRAGAHPLGKHDERLGVARPYSFLCNGFPGAGHAVKTQAR